MKQLKIGVTGINAVDNPGPGIGVARSLKEAAFLTALLNAQAPLRRHVNPMYASSYTIFCTNPPGDELLITCPRLSYHAFDLSVYDPTDPDDGSTE